MREKAIRGVILGVVLSLASGAALAEDLVALAREDLRAAKRDIVEHSMDLSEAQAADFWPIYEEYEGELDVLTEDRIAAVRRYAEEHDSLTDERAAAIAEDWFHGQEERLKLRRKYYRKVADALSAGVAARFIQVENQIGLLLDLQIHEQLPLIRTR
ncbi:MAG: hypothetical protein PVF68_04840 [Acidobacteriota bacterium]|jgi:hypothetical protein